MTLREKLIDFVAHYIGTAEDGADAILDNARWKAWAENFVKEYVVCPDDDAVVCVHLEDERMRVSKLLASSHDALAQTAEAMTDAIQSRNLTEFKTVGEYFDRILAAPDDGVVERVRKGLEYGGEGGEAVTLREKLADMGLDADEQMKVLTFVEADAREREREAYVEGAWYGRVVTGPILVNEVARRGAEAEAASRYPGKE